jgi:hypothetical protein
MKKFLVGNLGFIIIIGYCIWSLNWFGAVGWGLALFQSYYKDEFIKIIDEDTKEIKKWYDKYIEAKYRK